MPSQSEDALILPPTATSGSTAGKQSKRYAEAIVPIKVPAVTAIPYASSPSWTRQASPLMFGESVINPHNRPGWNILQAPLKPVRMFEKAADAIGIASSCFSLTCMTKSGSTLSASGMPWPFASTGRAAIRSRCSISPNSKWLGEVRRSWRCSWTQFSIALAGFNEIGPLEKNRLSIRSASHRARRPLNRGFRGAHVDCHASLVQCRAQDNHQDCPQPQVGSRMQFCDRL